MEPDIAVYDYSRNNAPYSFGTLAQWAMKQKARAFFVINMQVALREDKDMVNLNLSRDLLSEINGIWIFGMTPDTDNRLVKIAYDFYSFVRIQAHFEDEGIENKTPVSIIDNLPSDKYYDTYQDAVEQMQRYSGLCEELMALPLTTEEDRLLSAAITLSNIADLYYNYGRYDDAMKLFEKVKAIREKVLGKEHPDTALAYHKIALFYNRQGDNSKALEWYEKALTIREKVLGKEHPDTAETYYNIAGIYYYRGDYTKILEWYEKDLVFCEKMLGKEDPCTAITYNNIAVVYHNQGDYLKALEWHKKALDIWEKFWGKEHPNTANSYNNIAAIYYRHGDYLKALEWHAKSYRILRQRLGEEYLNTVTVKNNMEIAYQDANLPEPFEEWFKKNF